MKKILHYHADHSRVIACAILCVTCVQCSSPRSEDPSGPVAITYWRTLSGAAGNAQDKLVAQFNDSQQAVRVTAEFQGSYTDLGKKLITASAAHTGPDVTQLGTYEILQFVRSGVLVDLKPFLDGPDGIDTSDWPGTMREAGEVDGGVYWLPFNVAAPVLYINTDAFKTASIAAAPKTWTEFFADTRALTTKDSSGRVQRAGTALWTDVWPYLSAIWSEGGELTSKDYSRITLNDPVAVRVLSEFQGLVRDGAAIVPDTASGGHRAAFKNGRAAMILDSPASFTDIFAQSAGFTPAVAAYPTGAAGTILAPGGGGLAMLAVTPENKRAAAWSFIRFLLAPQQLAFFAKESGYAAFTEASRKAAGDTLKEARFAVVHEALPHLKGDFSINMSPAVRESFSEAIQKILVDLADVNTALDAANAKAQQRIQNEIAKNKK
ncbi:MAG: ABC transporter substrate-binding protein [Candidatus Hydrogenedentes bacterium]|nr:ABC transporter substrate-binding protein [Candidatus Hydrogenedentota bacterium]